MVTIPPVLATISLACTATCMFYTLQYVYATPALNKIRSWCVASLGTAHSSATKMISPQIHSRISIVPLPKNNGYFDMLIGGVVLAITIGVRILGPALGFIVGSLCTSVYADLSVDPKIDTTDPRWVGAWWLGNQTDVRRLIVFITLSSTLGLVLISGLLMLASFAMFAFPKRLSSARPTPRIHKTGRKHPSIKGRTDVTKPHNTRK